MLFSDFSLICQQLEMDKSRLAKKKIVTNFFLKHDPLTIAKVVNVFNFSWIMGENNTVFQINETQIIKYIAEYLVVSIETVVQAIKELGDVGNYYLSFGKNNNKNIFFMTILDLLIEMATISGKSSQENKKKKLFAIFDQISALDSCYIIRFLIGSFRIGLSDKTIIEILADILVMKNIQISKKELTYLYGIQNNLGHITELVLSGEKEKLLSLIPQVGVMIQAQAAEIYIKEKIVIDFSSFEYLAQPKYDGFRLQVQIRNNQVFCYSRNGLLVNYMFPDIILAIQEYATKNSIQSAIFDGEVIGYDNKKERYLPFQDTSQRKRKHNINQETVCDLRYIIFDVLLYNENNMINVPYSIRLNQLKNNEEIKSIKQVSSVLIESSLELEDFYQKMIIEGYEGIMIKKIDSIYEPGRRTRTWLKYKKIQKNSVEDSIDAVILGYNFAKGDRKIRQEIGSLLLGIYDEKNDQYKTIAQVGTGGSAELWKEIFDSIEKYEMKDCLDNIIIHKIHLPDKLVMPELVVSLKADLITISKEHTSGYSLRFPRLLSIRKDKNRYQTFLPIITMSE